jgi:aminoglycoside 3-N-acetyltransferase
VSESDIIKNTTNGPVTAESLAADLSTLGVEAGMTLLVHSSLSALGWVCGGPVTVILALEKVLGPEGTLVMPTHSGDLSDPAEWENPPVPQSWWSSIRQTMPPYDANLTPSRRMGVIPETFRTQKGVLRSLHPQFSFAAQGPLAATITNNHALEFGMGNASPVGRLYDADGWVLLLGVGHDSNSSLHLAEYRANYLGKRIKTFGAPMLVNGQREWVRFPDVDLDIDDFETIGKRFAQETAWVKEGRVAGAAALLMPQRQLVDYAVQWMERNRRHVPKRSNLFGKLVDEAIHQDFMGWDFSFIAKRYVEDPTSWNYRQKVQEKMTHVDSLLDLGTGGGEFLSTLSPLPTITWATEAYPPNVPIARARLEPLGAQVASVESEADLPFEPASFELIINRHEAFSPGELYRVLKPGGTFLTQQLGGQDNIRINELLQEQALHGLAGWDLTEAVEQLMAAGFEIIEQQEEFPEAVYYDIGAVVYYLKATPWQIPNFIAAHNYDRLQRLHDTIQSQGGLVVKSHRFYIEARKR